MESNTKPSMMQTALTWGLITGFASIIYTLILYFSDLILNKPAGYAGMVISIIGIFLGIKAFRDNSLDGYISYGRALGTGVLISLFASILSVIFMFILYTVIDTELVSKILAETETQMAAKNLPSEQVEKAMEMTKKLFLPMLVVMGILGGVFFGFIISLIEAAILKKDGNSFDRNMSGLKSE